MFLCSPSQDSPARVPTITLSPVPEESSTDQDVPEENQRSLDKSQFTFTPADARAFVDKTRKPYVATVDNNKKP